MSKEILEKLQELIREYSGNSDLQISEDSSLINDLQLSSLDVISLVGIIEDTFDIEFDDENIAGMITVKDVVEYISSKKKEQVA
ncbi:MAG: acyl carrier protein [Erysipelotrichaceae bacterium]|nr:acyl carrier protein [Erysipelotrichaceae bacterium]